MTVQGPPLRALNVSPCFYKGLEGALTPLREVGVRILNYLDDWLILAQSESSCAITGTWCFGTSASWGFGSTGKRASSPQCRETLFSVWSLTR